MAIPSSQLQGVDKKSILNKVDLSNFKSSTKLEALVEELEKMKVRRACAST